MDEGDENDEARDVDNKLPRQERSEAAFDLSAWTISRQHQSFCVRA